MLRAARRGNESSRAGAVGKDGEGDEDDVSGQASGAGTREDVMACVAVELPDPRSDFAAWLGAHGVKAPCFAEAVEREFGIGDYDDLMACAEDEQVTLELFAMARCRLPFALYAALRRVIKACVPALPQARAEQEAGVGLRGLLAIIVATLSSLSQELLQSAHKFSALDPTLGQQWSTGDGYNGDAASPDSDGGVRLDGFVSPIPYEDNAVRIKTEDCKDEAVEEEVVEEEELHGEGTFAPVWDPAEFGAVINDDYTVRGDEGVDTMCITKEDGHGSADDAEGDEALLLRPPPPLSRSPLPMTTLPGPSSSLPPLPQPPLTRPPLSGPEAMHQQYMYVIQLMKSSAAGGGLDSGSGSGSSGGSIRPFAPSVKEAFASRWSAPDGGAAAGGGGEVTRGGGHLPPEKLTSPLLLPPPLGAPGVVIRKPFVCQLCGEGFTHSSGLSRHKRIHTEKLYKCHECGKEFLLAYTLKRHRRVHM
ncbi:unnamed protein product [Lampetra fluviatilis]